MEKELITSNQCNYLLTSFPACKFKSKTQVDDKRKDCVKCMSFLLESSLYEKCAFYDFNFKQRT